MVDNEKQENLANARRKLKQFRDQQQPNSIESNGNHIHPINGVTSSSQTSLQFTSAPQNLTNFVNEQQTLLNSIDQNLSQSRGAVLQEQNRPSDVLIDKQERTRHENHQRQSSGGSNMSRHSNQTPHDSEQKLRRDAEHLQEQLEIHVQTIGILVAEKTDVSAKLTQSFKQLERKQSEMDELYGRLKASRERVQELEKQMQNSTSNVQKREMAAKESDKENDRLKIENIKQSQFIEDLKQNIIELNDKLHNRQNNIDQLNIELDQLKKQSLSSNETSTTEQQLHELQQTVTVKNNQIEEFLSSINRMRSDNEQYQQYNTTMQHHIQELNDQINQLTQTNHILQTKQEQMTLSDHNLLDEHDTLQQENQLFRNAIDQWSNRYEELRVKLEQLTKLSTEKDEHIAQLKTNSIDEVQNELQFNERIKLQNLEQIQSKSYDEQETQTEDQQIQLVASTTSNDDKQHLTECFNQVTRENIDLKERIQHLEHVIQQLQSETDTIGDYIHLYQQQREQLQKRYQEKDDRIQQITQDRLNLQKKLSELEILLAHSLNIPIIQSPESNVTNASAQFTSNSNENGQSEINDNLRTISNQTMPLLQLNDETRARIWTLIQELGQNNRSSSSLNDPLSTIQLAFVDQNLYICSTCSGPVQWV